jgi:hypothetical protein
VAADLGAGTVTLEGLGHWWMFEGSKPAAEALVAHWEAALDTTNGIVDGIKFAAFRLDQLTIQFVLNRVSGGIEHIACLLLVQLSKQAQVALQCAMKCVATSNELLTQFDYRIFPRHRITSWDKKAAAIRLVGR